MLQGKWAWGQKNQKIWQIRREQNSVTNKFLLRVGAKLPGCDGVSIIFYLEKCEMFILSQNK